MKKILILALSAAVACSCGTSRVAYDAEYERPTEKVNLGYGSVAKEDNSFAATNVKIDEKELSGYTDIFDYIRGRVPGVQIGQASPGSMPSITIRGASSINSSTEPLILLDGVVTNNIAHLSPQDVGSIDVLKDASAAIYGARGANGVIMITTKGYLEVQKAEAEARKAEKAAKKAAKKAR